MRRRSTSWLVTMWVALSACEGREPSLPEGFGSPEALARGRRLFVEHCALCHGERADGRGRRRASLSGPPADFTDPSWPERTSPQRAFETIRNGRSGTSMPAWKVLTDQETWDLVSYLRSVSRPTPEGGP